MIARAVLVLGDEQQPAPVASLRDLLDRPFLQRQVEFLAAAGVSRVDLLTYDEADSVSALIGDGERWGIQVEQHLVNSPRRPLRNLRSLLGLAAGDAPDTAVILGVGARLPLFELPDRVHPLMVLDPSGRWTRWAMCSASDLSRITSDARWEDLETTFRSLARSRGELRVAARVLAMDTWQHAAGTTRALLDGTTLPGATDLEEPSERIAVHPSARIHAPVYLGENVRISAGAEIGPYTVVGANTLVDTKVRLRGTVVQRDTYVGAEVSLEDTWVSGDSITDIATGARQQVTDHSLLADLDSRPMTTPATERCLAAALAASAIPFALPALAYAAARGWRLREVTRATVPGREGRPGIALVREFTPSMKGWSAAAARLLVRLADVVAGRRRLLGLPARTRAQFHTLPDAWRSAIADGWVGAVAPTLLYAGSGSALLMQSVESVWVAETHAGTVAPVRAFARLALDRVRSVIPRSLWRKPRCTRQLT